MTPGAAVVGGGTFLATLAGIAALGVLAGSWAVYLLVVPVLLAAPGRWRVATGRDRSIIGGVVAAAVVLFGGRLLAVAARNVADPQEWDFQAFWLWGRATAAGLNPYLPASLQRTAEGSVHSAQFIASIVDVGFLYPPPSLLLFWPLGWLGMRPACAGWYLVNAAALLADLALLWRLCLPGSGAFGLAVVAALTFALRATQSTVFFAQTNFLALLFLLLYWRDRERPIGGVWLGLGMVTKPWVPLVLLHPLLRGRWRTLVAAAGTLAFSYALAASLLGSDTVLSYFRDNPVARLPGWTYSEEENQSLLGALLRWTGQDGLARGLAIAAGGLLMLTTSWITVRLAPSRDAIAFGAVLGMALLVYPGTLAHYGVVLIGPLLWVWGQRRALGVGPLGAGGLVTGVFVLTGAAHAALALPGMLLYWSGMAALAARSARPQ